MAKKPKGVVESVRDAINKARKPTSADIPPVPPEVDAAFKASEAGKSDPLFTGVDFGFADAAAYFRTSRNPDGTFRYESIRADAQRAQYEQRPEPDAEGWEEFDAEAGPLSPIYEYRYDEATRTHYRRPASTRGRAQRGRAREPFAEERDRTEREAGPYAPFLEAGLSVEFAGFCLLHGLTVEWLRKPRDGVIQLSFFKGIRLPTSKPILDYCFDPREISDMDRHCWLDIERMLTDGLTQALLAKIGISRKVTDRAMDEAHEMADRAFYNDRNAYGRNGPNYFNTERWRHHLFMNTRERERGQYREEYHGFRTGPNPNAGRNSTAEEVRRRTAEEELRRATRAARAEQEAAAKRAWDEMMREAFGNPGQGSDGTPPPKAKAPEPKFKAGKSYTAEQKAAIVKARKLKPVRDDIRTDKGSRDNAGRIIFNLLNKHSLTEADLWG